MFKKGQLIYRTNTAHHNHFVYYFILDIIDKYEIVGQRIDTYCYYSRKNDIENFIYSPSVEKLCEFGDPVY